jgi:hypothetical protein
VGRALEARDAGNRCHVVADERAAKRVMGARRALRRELAAGLRRHVIRERGDDLVQALPAPAGDDIREGRRVGVEKRRDGPQRLKDVALHRTHVDSS